MSSFNFKTENSMETEEEGPSALTSGGTPSPSTSQLLPSATLPAPPTSISAPEDLSGSVAALDQVTNSFHLNMLVEQGNPFSL